ncbi:hypothetical protein D3C78_1280650 [compost metagenome]
MGEAAGLRRRLDESLVDAAVRELPAQDLDQIAVPAGMHHAEAAGIEEQRQRLEPAEEIAPVGGVAFELLQRLVDQPLVAGRVLAHVGPPAAGRRRRRPAQRIELVVAHDAQRLARGDHGVHPVQRLADARAAIDDVAEEQRLPPRMPPDVAPQAIAEGFQQTVQRMRTTVHIADQVIAAGRVQLYHSLPPRRLPHPSLVRQTS